MPMPDALDITHLRAPGGLQARRRAPPPALSSGYRAPARAARAARRRLVEALRSLSL